MKKILALLLALVLCLSAFGFPVRAEGTEPAGIPLASRLPRRF